MRNLQHVQRKDIETITRLLQDFRCEGCANNNKSAKDKVAGEKQEHQHQQQTQLIESPYRYTVMFTLASYWRESFKIVG